MGVNIQNQMNRNIDVNSILGTLNQFVRLAYVEYVTYQDHTISMYTSNDALLSKILHDEQTHFPLYDKEQRQYLKWSDYLSDDLLGSLQEEFELSAAGFTLVLKHNNMAEHFSLTVHDDTLDVFQFLTSNPTIQEEIIDRIRYYVYSQELFPSATIDLPLPLHRFFNQDIPLDLLSELNNSGKKFTVVGPNGQFAKITAKEKYCLISMAQLKTLKDIADELKVSLKAGDSSLSRIKQKLGVINRNQLYDIVKNNQLL